MLWTVELFSLTIWGQLYVNGRTHRPNRAQDKLAAAQLRPRLVDDNEEEDVARFVEVDVEADALVLRGGKRIAEPVFAHPAIEAVSREIARRVVVVDGAAVVVVAEVVPGGVVV